MYKIRFLMFSILFMFVLAVFSFSLQSSSAEEPIGSVTVTADKQAYDGRCPAQIKFTGTIQVNKYPMTLNYHWLRSDGAKSPVKVVRVPNAHTKTITVVDHWRVGAKGQHKEVWVKLQANSGNTHVTSDPATVTLNCK